MEQWVIEILKGFGKLFLHPILYLSVIFAIVTGYFRVKSERRDFNTRLLDGYHDTRVLLSKGILFGLLFSIPIVVAGVVIPVAAILVSGILTFLFALTFRYQFLSPAIIMGSTYFILIGIDYFQWEIPFLSTYFDNIDFGLLRSVVILMGLLTIIEGLLIRRNGGKNTSPRLIQSPRGLKVGAHQSKKLWLVPMLVLLPTGEFTLPFEWWPVFTIGSGTYSLFLVPFLFGFQQLIQSTLPETSTKQTGYRVFWLGALVLTLGITGFFAPLFSVIAGALAVLGRVWISYRHRVEENSKPFFYNRQPKGVMIIDILQDSPAEKLALVTGEIITKVNGIEVNDERAFYRALQKNGAYCKLEVIGTNNEIRFTQGALYEGDHHELGILFVEQAVRDASDRVS
jgi:hypothetical protein